MTHVDEEDLFEITLAKCRAGFEMRQPDAKATAEKLLVTYAAQASTLHLRADARWMKMAL